MRNEDFECENCGKKVKSLPSSARNHCPFCLYSKHLDEVFPGDRQSNCGQVMTPIGIDYKKNKDYMIRHKCQKCGKEILNKVAEDDNFLDFVRKMNKLMN